MANILCLVNRLPYPPNKGDKVRSYHLLKHLARKHRGFLGTFVDGPDDEAHVSTVPDVRLYFQYAAAVVAPLRIARGIQNKILEAMSMAKPVIASMECAAAVDTAKDTALLTADDYIAYIAELAQVLDPPAAAAAIGRAARQRVVERYSWEAHLEAIDRYLPRTKALPQ